jgi:ATP-dependent RNA helicase DDX52/ROK1
VKPLRSKPLLVHLLALDRDSAALNIKQSLTYVGTESGKLTTLRLLLRSSPPLPLLIFVQSRERATELHQELLYDGLSVDVLHSEMTRKQREESVSRMRRGETWVMVCTEVMARGMDFGGIKGVLNYDFPQSVQSYVHRIGETRLEVSCLIRTNTILTGRTGRAGREGVAITYFTDDDAPYLKSLVDLFYRLSGYLQNFLPTG